MKITIHLDLEEMDYIAIVQAANYKRKSTEDFIKEAIREAIDKAMIDMRLEQTQSFQQRATEQQDQGTEKEVRGSENKEEKKER